MHQQDRAQGSPAATPTGSGSVRPVWHALRADDDVPVSQDGAGGVPVRDGARPPVPGRRPVQRPSGAPAAAAGPPAAGDRGADGALAAAHNPAPDAGPPRHDDVRAAARASLAAGRSASLWWVCTGLAVSVVVAWTIGATQGALALAVLLAVSAVARAVLPRGPVALAVRSRTLDTAVLLVLALGVGVLSQLIPTR